MPRIARSRNYKHVADDDVRFSWDRANAEHIARHSVRPDEAEQAIRNNPLDMNYEVIDGEERSGSAGGLDRADRRSTGRHRKGCWKESARGLFTCQRLLI